MGISNSNSYKLRNRPNISENSKYHQGTFVPSHPEKCLTKINIYRSDWERKFMEYCDRTATIVQWGSEPFSIPYKNPVTNLGYCKKNGLNPRDPHNWKLANYYVDFFIKVKQKDGSLKRIFIEVKPYSQTQPPKPINESDSLKEQKRYCREAQTYLVNQEKWKSAIVFFRQRGCDFQVFTERTLERLGCMSD